MNLAKPHIASFQNVGLSFKGNVKLFSNLNLQKNHVRTREMVEATGLSTSLVSH
jgi:hypothetical protein